MMGDGATSQPVLTHIMPQGPRILQPCPSGCGQVGLGQPAPFSGLSLPLMPFRFFRRYLTCWTTHLAHALDCCACCIQICLAGEEPRVNNIVQFGLGSLKVLVLQQRLPRQAKHRITGVLCRWRHRPAQTAGHCLTSLRARGLEISCLAFLAPGLQPLTCSSAYMLQYAQPAFINMPPVLA